MISARVPAAVIDRLDFVVRNTEDDDTRNRSAAVHTALEFWLHAEEIKLETKGLLSRKNRDALPKDYGK